MPLEASGLYELAQVQLQSGNIEVALDYLSEAVQLFAQVFGPLHVNIANCYKVIARIHHALGDSKLSIHFHLIPGCYQLIIEAEFDLAVLAA
uniref:Kinesin light chain n=1 Tax=Amphimedon queenslandica TaxID=400682 RepID=A0A1X7T1G8_AMPQE